MKKLLLLVAIATIFASCEKSEFLEGEHAVVIITLDNINKYLSGEKEMIIAEQINCDDEDITITNMEFPEGEEILVIVYPIDSLNIPAGSIAIRTGGWRFDVNTSQELNELEKVKDVMRKLDKPIPIY